MKFNIDSNVWFIFEMKKNKWVNFDIFILLIYTIFVISRRSRIEIY